MHVYSNSQLFRFTVSIGILVSLTNISMSQTLIEIRDSAARNAELLVSTSYESLVKNMAGAEQHFRFARNGAKFLVERSDILPMVVGGEPVPLTSSKSVFDGTRYFRLDRNSGRLKQSTNQLPTGGADPFVSLHGWLLFGTCVPATWESLHNRDVWVTRFKDARLLGPMNFSGQPCVAIEFPQTCTARECVYRVYFLQAENWFPLGYERFNKTTGALSTLVRVDEFAMIEASHGEVAFPIRMTYEENGADGVSFVHASQITIAPDKIDLNAQHADSVFSISTDTDTDEVKSVLDVQKLKASSGLRKHIGGKPVRPLSDFAQPARMIKPDLASKRVQPLVCIPRRCGFGVVPQADLPVAKQLVIRISDPDITASSLIVETDFSPLESKLKATVRDEQHLFVDVTLLEGAIGFSGGFIHIIHRPTRTILSVPVTASFSD